MSLLVEKKMGQGGLNLQQTVCGRRKTKSKEQSTKKYAAPIIQNKIHISPATATNSRRRATHHGPRASPCSLASIDPVFVEICLLQVSQSVKATKATHADGRADRLINPSVTTRCVFVSKENDLFFLFFSGQPVCSTRG